MGFLKRDSFQCELIFIFIELSETLNSFVKLRPVLEITNVPTIIHKILETNSSFHVK